MSNSDNPLFQPLTIRNTRLKNRLFMAAHGTGYAEGGNVGERALDYYEARVANGVSLVVTEAHTVTPLKGQKYAQLTASDDACIPGLQRLTELCQKHDCKLFGQLYHPGRARAHSLDGSADVTVAPSSLPDERYHSVPHELTVAEIRELVQLFGEAAGRMSRAGVDGVELLVGMGYLHSQFLSPMVNQRQDEYGGSAENRLRFLKETLRAIREHVGDKLVVGIRIAGQEYDPDGLTEEVSLDACRQLEADDLCDYFSLVGSGTHGMRGASYIVPPMFVEAGYGLEMAGRFKRALSKPVMIAGRINQPQDAEVALKNNQADMIGLVRALIADPEFVKKAEAGKLDNIRACIGCNQACIGHRHAGYGVSCIQYPETGRESEFAIKVPVSSPKNVLVIGGGPGGMKAAAVAAERGHRVTLCEKRSALGGQAYLAQSLPGRTEFGGIITNLKAELERFGAEIRLNTPVDSDFVQQLKPDSVIVATGAEPASQNWDIDPEADVVDAWDVITGKAKTGSSVIIYDWRCDWVGLGVAELLAQNGCAVRLCVNGEMAGQGIQSFVRQQWAGRLHRLGVNVEPYLRLYGADPEAVYFQHIMTEEPVVFDGEYTLVTAGSRRQVTCGVGDVDDVYYVGDCVSPRTAEEAVLEGLRAGCTV